MKPIENACVLITGGSKGIGLALAKEFARHGHNLILVARGEEALTDSATMLRESYGVSVETIAMDISTEHAPEKLFDTVAQAGLMVDILVNNAGTGMTGPFAEADDPGMKNMLKLNILTLNRLTRLFLPPMLERRRGRILNVASVVAYFSGAPNWAAYVASKHYVLAFTRGLARELRGTGVAATAVSPGTIATDFVKTANAADMRAYRSPGGASAEHTATLAYRASQKGKTVVIPGMLNKVLAFLGELPPRVIAFEVFAFLSQKAE